MSEESREQARAKRCHQGIGSILRLTRMAAMRGRGKVLLLFEGSRLGGPTGASEIGAERVGGSRPAVRACGVPGLVFASAGGGRQGRDGGSA
ncbi:MAG: hypothetical protein AW11_00978 [Candidatus Accumulibacter regalis]|uniref:Uncharacterized protein n=1 Tax=Accumulibacter regalis TaxID=522306 RepID=A0A011QMK4_ACCRE|nr:MAG: hypothetical protein AW11_00978 [Candidatus Accumulibacter regalis]